MKISPVVFLTGLGLGVAHGVSAVDGSSSTTIHSFAPPRISYQDLVDIMQGDDNTTQSKLTSIVPLVCFPLPTFP